MGGCRTYRASNLRISAWEYAAPTTMPEPGPPDVDMFLLGAALSLGGGLQNGDADLDRRQCCFSAGDFMSGRGWGVQRTLSGLIDSNWSSVSKR